MTAQTTSLLLLLSVTLLLLQGGLASLNLDTAHVIQLRIKNASFGERACMRMKYSFSPLQIRPEQEGFMDVNGTRPF